MHLSEAYGNDDGLFTAGDPASGVPATRVTYDIMNALVMEIVNVIEAAGLTLLTTDTDTYNQLLAAILSGLVLTPAYTSEMVGNETFEYSGGSDRKYLLDPNGGDRSFNPSGTFPAGFEAIIINNGGTYNIVFDSSNSSQIVTPGAIGRFIYNGTTWI